MGEARGIGRDPHVAHHRQVEPTRERGPVHRGEHREWELDAPAVPAVARGPERRREGLVVETIELAQVEARAERVARAGDDHHLDRIVAGEGVERVGELVAHGDGQRVLLLRSVQRQGRDAVGGVGDEHECRHGREL